MGINQDSSWEGCKGGRCGDGEAAWGQQPGEATPKPGPAEAFVTGPSALSLGLLGGNPVTVDLQQAGRGQGDKHLCPLLLSRCPCLPLATPGDTAQSGHLDPGQVQAAREWVWQGDGGG